MSITQFSIIPHSSRPSAPETSSLFPQPESPPLTTAPTDARPIFQTSHAANFHCRAVSKNSRRAFSADEKRGESAESAGGRDSSSLEAPGASFLRRKRVPRYAGGTLDPRSAPKTNFLSPVPARRGPWTAAGIIEVPLRVTFRLTRDARAA